MAKKTFFSQVVYPVSSKVFLQKIKCKKTLIESGKPIMKYIPLNNEDDEVMVAGKTYKFEAKVFSLFSIGQYFIDIIASDDERIYSMSTFEAANEFTHYTDIKTIDETHTMCTHQVEMEAGWLTSIMYFITKLYYKNKERKLKKLFAKNK